MSNISEYRQQYPDSWLLQYIEKCKEGQLLYDKGLLTMEDLRSGRVELVGRELMQMLDILLGYFEDPTAIFTDGITFEIDDAHKRIKFIEKECKHYEAPFAGKPFILTLRQKAYIEAFYSFKIYDEEAGRRVRLFQERLHLVARKCGKTPLEAAMDLAEWFCGEMGTKILCSSNDYEQADLMFQAINAMREESPALEKVTRKNIKGIFFGNPKKPKKRGKFSYQNKGNIRKISAKTGAKEGKNIKVGAADEIHELTDNSSIMPIRQALSTQDEPIFSEITTEGFTEDGYLDERLKEARAVLNGELFRPRWLIWLYTQDSETEIWQDERTWYKANPDLGIIKKWSFLRQMVEEARTSSATRAFVLAKDFNIKQSSATSWMQEAEIINNLDPFDIKEFRGAFYIAGNDFAETTDLCASKLLLMKPDDKMVYFYSHYWIPESKLKEAPDDANYEQWARDGYLTIVPGSAVESSIVADWKYELYKEYDLKPFKSGYDNRYAKDYIKRMAELFGEGITENVPQDAKCLNNPMRRLESDMRSKLVNYNNLYGDIWCFKNTGFTLDKLGRMMPCKKKTTHRIDGSAAGIIAYTILDWHRSEFTELIRR
jgi:phage terminase large subunit-like protein